MPRPEALYEPAGGRFVATELTRGPWNPDHQHAGPPAALLARAIARESGIAGGQTARLSFDILGPVPLGEVEVECGVVRAGRRVEQLEARLSAGGRVAMRATAWRMRTADSSAESHEEPPPPPPETARHTGFDSWPGDDEVAYRDALDWHWIEGTFGEPGPATVWTRMTAPLVAGEETDPVGHLLVMADAASGVSAELDWNRWLFVNVDLTIHLKRPPEGDWMAVQARTRIGEAGAGVCSALLSDRRGRVGYSAQSLLIEPR